MFGRANNGGSVFSWADEVEKEEEEEAAAAASSEAQPQQRQKKPNPFGSARPREVVLQDKGIDWRQLDLHLQQPSPLLISRNGSHENEKLQKQSNPQHVTWSPRIQSPILCVPPLRYPPKYVAGILYQHWVSMAPNASRYQHLKIERRRTRNEFVEAKEAQEGQILEGKENFDGLPLVNPEMNGKRMPLSATGIGNIHVDSGAKGYQKAPRFVHKASKQWCSSKEEF
ncbi:hypothetical protein HRI_002251500 [Hibiscus trionum]|uniref:Uncharacterized protein n=1 Tax=Hibiscus trionum TaxID=183268 RepID=A0A9W7HYN4_HIBTR|nr:hypothetical protein HRI_002251500 [Hibiscus trionum]